MNLIDGVCSTRKEYVSIRIETRMSLKPDSACIDSDDLFIKN